MWNPADHTLGSFILYTGGVLQMPSKFKTPSNSAPISKTLQISKCLQALKELVLEEEVPRCVSAAPDVCRSTVTPGK